VSGLSRIPVQRSPGVDSPTWSRPQPPARYPQTSARPGGPHAPNQLLIPRTNCSYPEPIAHAPNLLLMPRTLLLMPNMTGHHPADMVMRRSFERRKRGGVKETEVWRCIG